MNRLCLAVLIAITTVATGSAAWEISVKTGETPVYESKATLQDHGTGAKSALPDHN
jgi:hypothetical protein